MLLCKEQHPLEDLTLLEYGIRVAKFDPNVISQRTTKIKSLVVLIIILVVLIFLPDKMYLVLVLIHMILLFLLVRER